MNFNPETKYRRSTGWEVYFPTIPSLFAQPGEVDLFQEHGSHDVLEMLFIRPSGTWEKYLETGTPVVFTWSQGSLTSNWIGYVTHVKAQNAVQERRELKVICSSATYLLKERATKTWTNKSITDVAKLIADEFGLNILTEPSRRKFEQLSITGETYWEWLRHHANKIGYGLTFRGTDLVLKPLDKLLNESTYNSPVLSIRGSYTSANVAALDRTLDDFTLNKSDFNEANDNLFTRKNVSGVNPITSKALSKTATPSNSSASSRTFMPAARFTEFTKEVVHSDSFARLAAKDTASNSSFTFIAKARGQGDPRIAPLNAVQILGTGTASDGYWVVDKVHHAFNITGLYEVDMTLRTDGVGNTVSSPFRRAASNTSNTINVEQKVVDSLKRDSSSYRPARLNTKTFPVTELNQGFSGGDITWRRG